MVFFHLLGRQDFIVLTLGFVAPLHLDGGTQGAGDPDFRCRRVDTAGFTCNSHTRGERDGPREMQLHGRLGPRFRYYVLMGSKPRLILIVETDKLVHLWSSPENLVRTILSMHWFLAPRHIRDSLKSYMYMYHRLLQRCSIYIVRLWLLKK